MTHSKLTHSIWFVAALAAFAVTGAGCAMNAGEPIAEERTETAEEDLRKAPIATPSEHNALSDNADDSAKVFVPKAAVAQQLIINNNPVLGGGGQDEDGPRPHPWSPAPETAETNTNTNSGSSSGSSSSQ